MFNKTNKIKVTVDKSHLFTLGERMYRESIEFVRELVNNAYDADASEVFVLILQKSTDEVGRPRLPIADEVSLS